MLFSEFVKSELFKFNCNSLKEKMAQLTGLLVPWYYSKKQQIVIKTKDQRLVALLTELTANNIVCEPGLPTTLKLPATICDVSTVNDIWRSKWRCFFLRGLYLSAGHMCDPKKDYRITISFKNADLATEIAAMWQLSSHINQTTNKYSSVLYIRNISIIEEFLTIVGAVKSCFELMNTRIYKELRNKVNRVTNCDNANINKTVASAKKQLEAIKKMQAAGQLAALAPKYKLLAEARLENPQASNSELAATLGATRGTIGHGFKKILEASN